MRTLLLSFLVVITIGGCTDPVGSIGITLISARFTAERFEVRTVDSTHRSDRVQAEFHEDADASRPIVVDSVVYNETSLPLISADSGLYRIDAPIIASIAPGSQQRFRVIGNARFPSVVDSILQPQHVDVIRPVAGSDISLVQDIPVSWVPSGDRESSVVISIYNEPTRDGRIMIYSTEDDGEEMIPARLLFQVLSGDGYLFVSRGNEATRVAGERNYQIRARSITATQVTFRR